MCFFRFGCFVSFWLFCFVMFCLVLFCLLFCFVLILSYLFWFFVLFLCISYYSKYWYSSIMHCILCRYIAVFRDGSLGVVVAGVGIGHALRQGYSSSTFRPTRICFSRTGSSTTYGSTRYRWSVFCALPYYSFHVIHIRAGSSGGRSFSDKDVCALIAGELETEIRPGCLS